MDKDKKYRPYVVVFALHFLTAFLAFGIILLQNKGMFTIATDYNNQQIPFMSFMNEAIKRGDIFWSWKIDLGSDFVSSMSWYSLGSPFFWLTLPFPSGSYIYILPWIFMLKYAVAGLTSFLYLERFVKEKKAALIGSVLYAFSGFQSINIIFNHFHDVVAFFPLLLLGVEKITEERKKGWLIFAVCLAALTNYYFLIQQVIFVILYYFVKNGFKKISAMLQCLVEGILGLGCAAIIFLPAVYLTLGNPRISESLGRDQWFDWGRRYMLQMFRVFFFPGETMGLQSCVYSGNWSSWSAYLPMVSMIPVLAFFVVRRWNWLHRFLILLGIMAYIPVLNSVFTLFSNLLHYRWYFMLTLLMALASALVLDQREKYKLKPISWLTVIVSSISVYVFVWWNENMFPLIFNKEAFVKISLMGIMGFAITAVLFTFIKKERLFYTGLLVGTTMFGAMGILYHYSDYKNSLGEDTAAYYERMMLVSRLEERDERYRYNTMDNMQIFFGDISGIGCWHSTIQDSIYSFWNAVSTGRAAHSPQLTDSLRYLLAAGYDIVEHKEEPQKETEVTNVNHLVSGIVDEPKSHPYHENGAFMAKYGGRELYIYEREDRLPIGFTYDTYMLQSEFDEYDIEQKPSLMLRTLVIPDRVEGEVSRLLKKENMQKEYSVEELAGQRREESSSYLTRNRLGFQAGIETKKAGYGFFSVPYASHWKCYVNNRETEIINCNGFMAVALEEGSNTIEFCYENRVNLISLLITIVCVTLSILYSKFFKL